MNDLMDTSKTIGQEGAKDHLRLPNFIAYSIRS